eukprot:1155955-Alexandrium_andersonii.AAC.1
MSASLVGSEMCIRDRSWPARRGCRGCAGVQAKYLFSPTGEVSGQTLTRGCLLYTSDAADDM